MGITKHQIADLAADLAGGGDPAEDSKFHPANIYKLVDIARDWLIGMEFNQARKGSQHDINGDFIKTFKNIDVEEDCDRGEFFSKLPSKFISLPGNRGIRLVAPMKSQKNEIVQVPAGSQNIYNGLEADLMAGRAGYYIEEDMVFYEYLDSRVKKVMIKLIPSIDSLDEDEQIPVPAGMVQMLLDKVFQQLGIQGQIIQDKHNDSNVDG